MSFINTNIALTGIQKGLADMRSSASDIAGISKNNAEGPGGMAESIVDLKVSEQQVSASVKVLKSADDMIGSLLDIKA